MIRENVQSTLTMLKTVVSALVMARTVIKTDFIDLKNFED